MRWFALLLLTVGGCTRQGPPAGATGQSVGEVVTNVVTHAQAGDTAYFYSLVDPSSEQDVGKLLPMIVASGMLTNYPTRLNVDSLTNARLDYHWIARGSHFQVDLQAEGSIWRVTRIWLCR